MIDPLGYIGAEPHLVGLATLGGLIGLAVFTVSAGVWLYGRGLLFGRSLSRRRVQKAREIAKGFRLARRGRQLGLSTISIIAVDIRVMSINLAATAVNFATMMMNASFAVAVPINAVTVVLNFVTVVALILGTRKIVDRMMARIRYAEAPSLFWPEAKEHIRVARKKRR